MTILPDVVQSGIPPKTTFVGISSSSESMLLSFSPPSFSGKRSSTSFWYRRNVHFFRGYGCVSGKEHFAALSECFGKLEELRSLFPPLSPVLATATATSATKATVIESLSLRPDMFKVYVSPTVQTYSYTK